MPRDACIFAWWRSTWILLQLLIRLNGPHYKMKPGNLYWLFIQVCSPFYHLNSTAFSYKTTFTWLIKRAVGLCCLRNITYHYCTNKENDIAAAKLVEVPGVFARIIPSALSLFSIPKLNLNRNNIHTPNQGLCLQYWFSALSLN